MKCVATKGVAKTIQAKPFLKWAGGKTQLLAELRAKAPSSYGQYIEPFIGGGAMFFAMQPRAGVIADSNPELVNVYKCLADNVEQVIEHLASFKNDETDFYAIRALRAEELEKEYAAARTIYLNRTCFNGLYRVNKKGEFNAPYGRYKNPSFCQPVTLRAASEALKNVEIICGDYRDVLAQKAKRGDFIFLDPPYLPVSKYADFKRYTKEQFYEEDHRELAEEVARLQRLGCHVILTNSNHPLVHELYEPYEIEIVNTRRNISSNAGSRTAEDVIVNVQPYPRFAIREVPAPLNKKVFAYPSTRYMGSKEKLLPYIQDVASQFEFDSALDLFSGSGVVGYLFKTMGKRVFTNDYMAMSATFSKAMVENNGHTLTEKEIDKLFSPNPKASRFVQETFEGLYYTDEENAIIDLVRSNICKLPNSEKRAIAMSALIRACLKKRARGIFTYTGLRYDDGRADLRMSMEEQIRNAAKLINAAVFDNGKKNRARHGDAMTTRYKADLVYIDPPYYSPLSDNEYVRRYHFVEGLARNWEDVDMQWHTKTKKFKNYPTPFSTRFGAIDAFDKLFRRLKDSILLVSYSSNSQPTREEIISLMSKYKRHVEVIDIDYRYSFANQSNDTKNAVQEYLFVGY
ncbi:Dam family site-specific DNA-(adenine-N6)-methyltransferase [Chromohalobacter sp. 48-RD10]|uniref:Dam family site-specific DNA-(adenine-N6)-methyltransferase n=1 Tax=Chromohalobacter sp. 48-RD10 TaxID=2994063 RepID=UPI0024685385|nr:Dam family site-specific DNA-(adenine-N6)-methyltransferase [Chromohalobacter sp. 48-RD10]